MTERVETQIEEYMNHERRKVLLDVSKHLLAGMMANPDFQNDGGLNPESAVAYAERLIREVESR